MENSFTLTIHLTFAESLKKNRVKLYTRAPWRNMGKWNHSSTNSLPRHYMKLRDQLHVPADLLPEKHPPLSLTRTLVGPQGRSARFGEKNLFSAGNSTTIPRSSIQQPNHYTDYIIPALKSGQTEQNLDKPPSEQLITIPWRSLK